MVGQALGARKPDRAEQAVWTAGKYNAIVLGAVGVVFVWTPTWINLGCFWAWQIPLAWLLAIQLGMGPRGVYIAMTVAFSTLAVVSGVIFRKGRWKTRRV